MNKEIPFYDWIERKQFEMLIYSGRVPNHDVDPGIVYSKSVLETLFRRGKLTGRALQDAKVMFRPVDN